MDIPVRTAQLAVKYLSRCIPAGRAEETELHNLIEQFQKIAQPKKRKT